MSEYDQQIDYDPDFLLADALLGQECEVFWAGQVGRYIRGRAEGEIQELMQDLYAADPMNVKEQTDIRQDIRVRSLMLKYLSEQIQNGQEAKLQLEENGD